jgi:hypothetical protein
VDVPDAPRRRPGPFIGEVPEQVGGGSDPGLLFGDQGNPLTHPGIFDELARLPFECGKDGADRHAHAGHHRGGVGIH